MLLGLGITWQVRAVMTNVFMNELENRGVSVASDLSERSVDPILLNDTFALYQLLTETIANNPDTLYAFVVDKENHVLAHTFGSEGFPVALLDNALTSLARPYGGGAVSHLVYQSVESTVHEFSAPIFDGRSGAVRVGLTETRLAGIVNAVTGQMLFTTLAVAIAGIVAAKTIAESTDLAAIREKNAEMGNVAAETLQQVRLLSRQLRPSILDDLGLSAALERYCICRTIPIHRYATAL